MLEDIITFFRSLDNCHVCARVGYTTRLDEDEFCKFC